jgi:hypothetical protein
MPTPGSFGRVWHSPTCSGDAVIAEPLRGTAALPTFFRTASGPGWALVGDVGHHKDPLIARGSPTHSATRTSLHRRLLVVLG